MAEPVVVEFTRGKQRPWWTPGELEKLRGLSASIDLAHPYLGGRVLLPHFPGRTAQQLADALIRLRNGKRKIPVLYLSPEDASYVAAMLEAEGCISVIRHSTRVMLISNKDPLLIEHVHRLVPFSTRQRAYDGSGVEKVMVTDKLKIYAVLRVLIPYMKGAKKYKAITLVEQLSHA